MNPYRKADGKYTTRSGQITAINSAIDSGSYDAYAAERRALDQADEAANHTEISVAPIHACLKHRSVDEADIAAALEADDRVMMETIIDERTSRPEFRDLLAERDNIRVRAKLLKDEYDFLKATYNSNPDFDYELVRAKGFELLNSFEELQVLKDQADEYKDLTSPLVARATELLIEERRAAGTYREYTDSTLNNLVATAEAESGSREWLEQRQKGIGGSDVGKILGVYKGYNATEEMLASKLEAISEDEVEDQADKHTDYTGAAGRGNAWEERIALDYAERHPDERIAHCKTSWQNSEVEYQFANFDGLMTDEDGKPNGILEIKTAADASKWGDPAAGIGTAENPNVPPAYRAQMLWYAQAAGFRKGAVAVMIDDHEYRDYHFDLDKEPHLEVEMQSNLAKMAEFWELKKQREANPRAVPAKAVRKGFGKTILVEAAAGKDNAFKEASIYREENVADTKRRFAELCADRKDPEQVRAALARLYTEKDPDSRKKKLVSLDLETSGSPTSGRIIELGMSSYDPKTGQTKEYSKLYGVGRRMERLGRTGATHVHGITTGMIKGKRQFSHPDVQREVLEELKGSILLAHNAPFEKAHLRQHLDGFAEAEAKGEIQILDSMYFTQRWLPNTPGNKLQDLVEGTGDEYVKAHRALNDAKMMEKGFLKLLRGIYKP